MQTGAFVSDNLIKYLTAHDEVFDKFLNAFEEDV